MVDTSDGAFYRSRRCLLCFDSGPNTASTICGRTLSADSLGIFPRNEETGHAVWDDVNPFCTIDITQDDIIAIVCLGRQMNVPSILPSAFSICAQLPYRTLAYGCTGKDGVCWKLSAEDLFRTLEGESHLRKARVLQLKHVLLAKPTPACLARVSCMEKLATARGVHLGTIHDDPGCPLREQVDTRHRTAKSILRCVMRNAARRCGGI